MNARKIVGIGVGAAVLLLVGAGVAQASDSHGSDNHGKDITHHSNGSNGKGYGSTQSPTQGADAGAATLGNSQDSFTDGTNQASGHGRPDGADGTDTEFGKADPRFVEGPAGGLAKNGPLG